MVYNALLDAATKRTGTLDRVCHSAGTVTVTLCAQMQNKTHLDAPFFCFDSAPPACTSFGYRASRRPSELNVARAGSFVGSTSPVSLSLVRKTISKRGGRKRQRDCGRGGRGGMGRMERGREVSSREGRGKMEALENGGHGQGCRDYQFVFPSPSLPFPIRLPFALFWPLRFVRSQACRRCCRCYTLPTAHKSSRRYR